MLGPWAVASLATTVVVRPRASGRYFRCVSCVDAAQYGNCPGCSLVSSLVSVISWLCVWNPLTLTPVLAAGRHLMHLALILAAAMVWCLKTVASRCRSPRRRHNAAKKDGRNPRPAARAGRSGAVGAQLGPNRGRRRSSVVQAAFLQRHSNPGEGKQAPALSSQEEAGSGTNSGIGVDGPFCPGTLSDPTKLPRILGETEEVTVARQDEFVQLDAAASQPGKDMVLWWRCPRS